ncbi:MAG TPA: ATP-binding protein, partial [Kofleriaceae bacterium]|nr:ATP-binding protein [Kofleriaceae bacterium]
MSHDLRTPLAVITGSATSLQEDGGRLPPGMRAELVDTIVGEARRLERVLQNLLGITRVETGLEPAREWVPIDELIGAALERTRDMLGDAAVTVDAPLDLLVPVDPVLFEQVLINLVENAVKYGRPPVEISARRAGDRIELDVRDHGDGLPEGVEERVFDKFFRVPGVHATGVGLGLAICRGIVLAHGGTITAGPARGGG